MGKIEHAGKSKVISTGKLAPVTGGKSGMFGKTKADTQKPGITSKATGAPGGKGGKGHMVGKTGVKPASPGSTGGNGSKAGNKTGSGGGKRGTGTNMDF